MIISFTFRTVVEWLVGGYRANFVSKNNYTLKIIIHSSKCFKNSYLLPTIFYKIYKQNIGLQISKQNTSFREAIPATERLMLTLRYLATGDSFTSLMYIFKISKQLISRIIPEVFSAIIGSVQEYVKVSN